MAATKDNFTTMLANNACQSSIEMCIHLHTKKPKSSRNLRYDPLSFAVA
jgi:hypothetical protein